jgi:hypothetical protein
MNDEVIKKLEEQQKKIDEIYISVEKTRKYFTWTMWITVIVVVLPIIGLVFAIPAYLKMIESFTSL